MDIATILVNVLHLMLVAVLLNGILGGTMKPKSILIITRMEQNFKPGLVLYHMKVMVHVLGFVPRKDLEFLQAWL